MKQLAERFSEFFVRKIQNIRDDLTSLAETTTALTCPPVSELLPKPKHSLRIFKPATVEEVVKVIKGSKKTTCSLDPIPTMLLADMLPSATPFIVHIINLSFNTGTFHESLKSAVVMPLLKKPGLDVEVLKNYRPVSNLSFLSKVVEKVISGHDLG